MVMATNFKEAASLVNGTKTENGASQGKDGGGPSFNKLDLVVEMQKASDSKDMDLIAKHCPNLGTQDKATNLLVEHNNLARSLNQEGKVLREVITQKVSFKANVTFRISTTMSFSGTSRVLPRQSKELITLLTKNFLPIPKITKQEQPQSEISLRTSKE